VNARECAHRTLSRTCPQTKKQITTKEQRTPRILWKDLCVLYIMPALQSPRDTKLTFAWGWKHLASKAGNPLGGLLVTRAA
jgi:hypothetical protein